MYIVSSTCRHYIPTGDVCGLCMAEEDGPVYLSLFPIHEVDREAELVEIEAYLKRALSKC